MGKTMIGTAGWSAAGLSMPRRFPGEGSHLQRYAAVPRGRDQHVFYRPHARRPTRDGPRRSRRFRFAVKMPREITHTRRLADADRAAHPLPRRGRSLGDKLGPLLVQLPPSLAFEPGPCGFFVDARATLQGSVACEPRHRSWFTTRPTRCWRGSGRARRGRSAACRRQPSRAGGLGSHYYRCTDRRGCTIPPTRPTPDCARAAAEPATTVGMVHLRQHRRGCGHARRDGTLLPPAGVREPKLGFAATVVGITGWCLTASKDLHSSRACPALRLVLPGVAAGPRRHTGRQAVARRRLPYRPRRRPARVPSDAFSTFGPRSLLDGMLALALVLRCLACAVATRWGRQERLNLPARCPPTR